MPQQQQQKTNNNANNFINYFNAKVLPLTDSIEKVRSKIKTGIIIWAILVCAVPLLLCLLIIFSKGQITDKLATILCLLVPAAVAVFAPVIFIKKIYAMFTKERIIPALLGFWGQFTYIPPLNPFSALYKAIKNKTGFGGFWSELTKDKKTNISVNPTILARLLRFDAISYDDKIVGKHNDVDIELAELNTFYTSTRTDRDGKQTKSKISTFKGVVFSVKMNKNFKGITAVSCDNIDKRRLQQPVVGANTISTMSLADVMSFGKQIADTTGTIKNITRTAAEMSRQGKNETEIKNHIENKYKDDIIKAGFKESNDDTNTPQKLEDVHLEDPLFNRKFKMCSTDQIEARYVFTTAFLSRFMKIAEKFNYRLHAIFIENNVYILINANKNWFEIPFFKSCKDPKNYQEFLNDFSRLLSIIDTLKLNQNIGL